MGLLWRGLLLVLISYMCYFPIFSIEDSMDELSAQLKFIILTPILLLVVGKGLLKLKIEFLFLIILISLILPYLTNRIYSEYQHWEIFHQTFTNESFQNQFFDPNHEYNRFIIKKVSYKDHHVKLKMNYDKYEGDTDEDLIQSVDNFVEEYTNYKNLHYLTAYVYFEDKTYIFNEIPLKKHGKPFDEDYDDNESLDAVENSLTIQ